jgi:gliding motility-associated lipoprotein GldH
MSKKIILSFLIVCTIAIAGCVPSPYYQKEHLIQGNEWHSKFAPTFKFEITDTTSLYNMYFLIRHTDVYPYSNIWVWVYTKQPGDSSFQKTRIEIPLAETSGKWLGRGMGSIWEHRMPITHEGDSAILNKRGKWEIRLEQNMRINPLPEVLQVGLRIEKINK